MASPQLIAAAPIISHHNQKTGGDIMTKSSTRHRLAKWTVTIALTATIGLAVQAPAVADTFPSKPIRFVVGFSAGSSVDTVARIVAEGLRTKYNWNVVVDNRTGANGQIAAGELQSSQPDGYTMLISNSSTITVNPLIYKKLAYDASQFVPVTAVVAVPFILTYNPQNTRLAGVKTLADLIDRARQKPDDLMYGSAGNGNLIHLASALLCSSAKVQMRHVPYRGAAPMQTAVLGREIDVSFDTTSAVPLIKSGNLNALAISAAERWPDLPDVPTVAEQGYPGYDVSFWVGAFLPPKTPTNVVKTFNEAFKAVTEDPKMRTLLSQQGRIMMLTSDQFAEKIKTETERNATIVKDAKIEIE
jgi:tripartite-type tricarboxylate transporter receptor subunit TctC